MPNKTACPCTENCPLQIVMKAIGGKWKMPILCLLSSNGPTRYNDIKRKTKGISNTMLAKALKELEEDGLVYRQEYLEIPVRVEYAPTEKAQSLFPLLSELALWGFNNLRSDTKDEDL